MRILIAVSLALFAAPTLAAKYQVPDNVTTRTGPYHSDYVDAVDFSTRATQPVEFAKGKLCVAENVTNSAVSLHDTSGSFVGGATGNYYQNSNSQTVQAGSVFKYIDDNAQTLIASGTTDGGATALGLTHDILKFDLKVVTIIDNPPSKKWWVFRTTWMLLTKNEALLARAEIRDAANLYEPTDRTVPLWTDDHASLFEILKK